MTARLGRAGEGAGTRLDASALKALEARLLATPSDAQVARVYADALIAAGDPRGELILVQRRLAAASSAEAASALDQRQIAVLEASGSAIYGRPGGFPFRRCYGTRGHLRFGDDGDANGQPGQVGELEIDTPAGLAMFRRVRRFVERLTDARGPEVVNLYGLVALEQVVEGDLKGLPSPATALLIGFMELLGPGDMRDQAIWTATHAPQVPQHAAWERFVRDWQDTQMLEQPIGLELTYRFCLTFPDTSDHLPFQHGVHYGLAGALQSVLVADLAKRTVRLHLRLPFESESDERFAPVIAAIEGELGPLRRALLSRVPPASQ